MQNNMFLQSVIMYRFVVFALVCIVISADEEGNKCGSLYRPRAMHCCAQRPFHNWTGPPPELKECFDIPWTRPPTCDREICIAKKKGYYTVEDGLDREALTAVVEKDMAHNPTHVANVKEHCLKADIDISKFGPPDMCDLMKMRHCFHIQLLWGCPEWTTDKPECAEIKGLLEECFPDEH